MIAWLLLACGAGPSDGIEVIVSDDVVTVITVEWSTSAAVTARVEYGLDAAYGMTTPWETQPTTEHRATLLGLPPEVAVHLRVVQDDGQTSADHTASTGSLPGSLPYLSAQGEGPEGWLVTSFVGAVAGPAITDAQGRLSWYHVDRTGLNLSTRARLSVDGESVLYGVQTQSEGYLTRVSLDGSQVTDLGVDDCSHDFVEHEDGTIAYLAWEDRVVDGEDVRGDQIIELLPDGTRTQIWSAFDSFDPADNQSGDSITQTWTHANALDYDADTDCYVVSLRNFSSVLAVARTTGELQWVIGGEEATIGFSEDSLPFYLQHQFELLDQGIIVFDNHSLDPGVSRVAEFQVRGDTATQVWEYSPDPLITALALGDVHRLDDGTTLVDWSSAGQMDRVAPDGELLWRMNSELATAFGYVERVDSLYPRP